MQGGYPRKTTRTTTVSSAIICATLALWLGGCASLSADTPAATAPQTAQFTSPTQTAPSPTMTETATATATATATPSPPPTQAPAPTVAPQVPATPRPAPQPTATPRPAPTPRPKPAPQPTPTPTPKPQPPPAKFTLAFCGAQAVDHQGGSVCVHTAPGAALTIVVRYCTGHTAVSRSLKGVSYADSHGNHTWTWVPDTKCPGPATATVTASWQGQQITASVGFDVR